ncbi:unnamed protein product [Mytilus coruscus]|uniref:Uncharacterized protein n=1 Tax=Mytilus coruscus TaxID=42192 RepID=A0A6J8AFG9_MYTCO|nr:unnamed protein product [Mytilus coruscus]
MDNTVTKEETNYLRIANLLLRVAPLAVRVRFDIEFDPLMLQKTLNQSRSQKLEKLRHKGIINSKQWDLLFPRTVITKSSVTFENMRQTSLIINPHNAVLPHRCLTSPFVVGIPVSSTFDITLMICLIRNLTSIQISDSLPLQVNTNLGADLSRIKYYRNQIAHCDDGILDDQTFHTYWDDICQALIRIGGPMYVQICADVKMSKLDQNDKEVLTEIRNLSRKTIPKVVLGIHGSKIQEWEENSEKIVETKAIMNLKDLIYKNGIVSITGPPGCGKSTAGQFVALYLQNYHGFDVVPANFPSEIFQYRNPERKQVFVYDDVCGKYEIEIHSVNDWIKLSPDIGKILTRNGVKVLATCRYNISRNKQFEKIKIFSKVQCDLYSHENSLTTDERILIAEKFLGKEDVDILKGHTLLDKYDMFPLLCRFYSRKHTGSVTEFFSRPVDVIKEDLESLMDADDQTSYATLALFVLCNNCIKAEMLSSSSSIKSILEELADRCTLRHVFSLQVVK